MQRETLEFQHGARVTYVAICRLFEMRRTRFSNVRFDDDLLVVEARRGSWISPFSENVRMKVAATGSRSCRVVVESSSRSVLNLLRFGANKGNVSDLSDYISNEVHRLCQPGEIPIAEQPVDHSTIRIVKPKIRLK